MGLQRQSPTVGRHAQENAFHDPVTGSMETSYKNETPPTVIYKPFGIWSLLDV